MGRLHSFASVLPRKLAKRPTYLTFAVLILAYSAAPAFSQERRAHLSESKISSSEQARTPTWTAYPALLPAGRGERGAAILRPLNSNAVELSVVGPDVAKPTTILPKVGGNWMVRQPDAETGGYHLLLAREKSAAEIRTASTLWMFQSKPQSPDKMLATDRPGLEIQPLALPQFGGFREGQTGEFLIRFDGIPLAGASLTIDTENGSHETVLADKNGVARVSFPRDFDPKVIEKEGGAARTRRSFVLGVALERNGVQHTTGLTLTYLPDLMRERNLMAGAGLFAFGMLLATPMLRRKKERPNV